MGKSHIQRAVSKKVETDTRDSSYRGYFRSMDIEEARSKKSKALGVLVKHQTDKAIDWLMEYKGFYDSPRIKGNDQIDAESVNRCWIFDYKEKHYEMYFHNERTTYFPDGESWGEQGEFVLIFEDEVVLKTTYSVEDDDYQRDRKISWRESSIKALLLSKWVEDIPEYVDREQAEIEERKKKDETIAEKAEIEDIESNLSLGDYE